MPFYIRRPMTYPGWLQLKKAPAHRWSFNEFAARAVIGTVRPTEQRRAIFNNIDGRDVQR
jgi:hypothetical protein